LGEEKVIEKVYLFPLYLKWEKGPTHNRTSLVTFVFRPAAENNTVKYGLSPS